jgi:hypothetical protein
MGARAEEICRFYEEERAKIFPARGGMEGWVGRVRDYFRPKFSPSSAVHPPAMPFRPMAHTSHPIPAHAPLDTSRSGGGSRARRGARQPDPGDDRVDADHGGGWASFGGPRQAIRESPEDRHFWCHLETALSAIVRSIHITTPTAGVKGGISRPSSRPFVLALPAVVPQAQVDQFLLQQFRRRVLQ